MTNTSEHYVLFCLQEYLAEEGAGFWSNDMGWTTEKDATRFTEAETRVLRKPRGRGDVQWMTVPGDSGLKGYLLRAIPAHGLTIQEAFFWADDAEHALEQARATEPAAKTWAWRVVSVNGVPVAKVTQKRQVAPISSRRIFLITKTGPEWQDPIEAWETKNQAEKRARELDKTLNPRDAIDHLSRHDVVGIILRG